MAIWFTNCYYRGDDRQKPFAHLEQILRLNFKIHAEEININSEVKINAIPFGCMFQITGKDMVRERKPKTVYWLANNLYLNITNKCSNNCGFCIRNFKKGVGGFNLKLEVEPSATEVIAELENVIYRKNWAELVFCGFGEPTERLDVLLEVTRWIRRHYGKPLLIRVNTNGHGYVLNRDKDVAKELKAAGVNKVSVSLNAGDEKTYDEVCRPNFDNGFGAVLEFIAKAKEALEVEITAVAIPEVHLQKIAVIAEEFGAKFRLRDYIPCFW